MNKAIEYVEKEVHQKKAAQTATAIIKPNRHKLQNDDLKNTSGTTMRDRAKMVIKLLKSFYEERIRE